MGGTAARLASGGDTITSVVLTDGRRSQNPFGLEPDSLANLRKEEAKKAASILGIQEVLFCDLPDLKSTENYQTAMERMEQIMITTGSEEVYILHPDLDRHVSHQLAGKVALDALRKLKRFSTNVWAYEVWGLFNKWDRFEDISGFVGKKLQAIQEHRSQVACVPYAEGVIGLNRWHAVFADPQQDLLRAAFAEVFLRCSVPED